MTLSNIWTIFAAVGIGVGFYFLTRVLAARYFAQVPQNNGSSGSFDYVQASNDTWRTVAQIIGGAAFGLTFAWTVLQDQAKNSREITHEANQMFIEGSKLLVFGNTPQRLAGVRVLELIDKERPDYDPAARDIFVSMIAGGSTSDRKHDEPGLRFPRNRVVELDVQAAIDSIGKLPMVNQDVDRPLDLSGLYMVGGKFVGSKGFAGALFYNTILHRSDFRGAHLERTRFDGAALSDWEAYGGAGRHEDGAWTADTPYKWREWERIRWIANFSGAHLEKATFTGTGLTGAWFFGADLNGADFSRANISRVRFENARNLDKAVFDGACYSPDDRDRPSFDSSVKVKFDTPKPHGDAKTIYIDHCS